MVRSFFFLIYFRTNMWFSIERHKSIYHQPSLSTYNPSERRRKRHRRTRPPTDSTEMSFRSIPSIDSSTSAHIGKTTDRFDLQKQKKTLYFTFYLRTSECSCSIFTWWWRSRWWWWRT